MRLAEDVYESLDLNNKKIDDFEDRLNHLKQWVEDLSKCSQGIPEISTSHNPGLVTKSDLMEFEKKLNKKILESLDETNSIMKKLKGQYRELSKRVDLVELGGKRKEPSKSSSKKRLKTNKSFEKLNSSKKQSSEPVILKPTKEIRRETKSSDRAFVDLHSSKGTVDAYKNTSEVIRTVAVPHSVISTNEKHSRENTSKEFTDFMTFEEQNMSDVFELSDNETLKLDQSRTGLRSSSRPRDS